MPEGNFVQPIDQATLVNSILAATSEVFEVMLNLPVTPGPALRTPPNSDPTEGVVALVGLAGQWVGTGILQCDTGMARVLFAHLLASKRRRAAKAWTERSWMPWPRSPT